MGWDGVGVNRMGCTAQRPAPHSLFENIELN